MDWTDLGITFVVSAGTAFVVSLVFTRAGRAVIRWEMDRIYWRMWGFWLDRKLGKKFTAEDEMRVAKAMGLLRGNGEYDMSRIPDDEQYGKNSNEEFEETEEEKEEGK